MENLTMSEKRKAKLEQEKNVNQITVKAKPLDVTNLIEKCDKLIVEASELYQGNSNKELNDAIIILHSAKRSLNLVSLN